LAAYHWAFLTGSALALLALLFATRISDEAAAPTMRRQAEKSPQPRPEPAVGADTRPTSGELVRPSAGS
jgi:hypothetical protein